MKILSWNVRNLSLELSRPGPRGRGMSMDDRLAVVAQNLAYWQPDIAFLIEAGPDGADIADAIKRILPAYQCTASPQTQTETFLCVARKEVGNLYGATLIGSTDYRQAWSVWANGLQLVVLHAPSPVHSIDIRINVISAILQQCSPRAVIMGDFNIRNTELARLSEAMAVGSFTFQGPSAADGPVSTSLRHYGNALKSISLGDVYSQPYDQFWSGAQVPAGKVAVCEPVAGAVPEAFLADSIAGDMENCVAAYVNRTPYNLRASNPDLPGLLVNAESLFRGLMGVMNGEIQLWNNKTGGLDLPNAEAVSRQMKACADADALFIHYTKQTENPAGYQALAYHLLQELGLSQGLAYCYLDSLSDGVEGLRIRSTAALEHSVSDHLPVQLVL